MEKMFWVKKIRQAQVKVKVKQVLLLEIRVVDLKRKIVRKVKKQ